MRFIAMQLRLALHAKFPETSEDEILKVVGNLLYYRYMNPAIVAPDAFDVVEMGVEQQLGAEQRRNLGAIAKILQTAAAGKVVSWRCYRWKLGGLERGRGYVYSTYVRADERFKWVS